LSRLKRRGTEEGGECEGRRGLNARLRQRGNCQRTGLDRASGGDGEGRTRGAERGDSTQIRGKRARGPTARRMFAAPEITCVHALYYRGPITIIASASSPVISQAKTNLATASQKLSFKVATSNFPQTPSNELCIARGHSGAPAIRLRLAERDGAAVGIRGPHG
jgi:hypothetical protein